MGNMADHPDRSSENTAPKQVIVSAIQRNSIKRLGPHCSKLPEAFGGEAIASYM